MDIQLRTKQYHQAAYAFMKRLVTMFGKPTVLTTDKAPALLWAFQKLKEQGFYKYTAHCAIKHLNNLIERDHKHVKRRFAKSAKFQTFVMLHVQSKESQPSMLYIRKTGAFLELFSFKMSHVGFSSLLFF